MVTDLDTIYHLSTIIHPDYPEDIAVYINRLELYPEGCFILIDTHCVERTDSVIFEKSDEKSTTSPIIHPHIVGYCLSHPWDAESAPPLDTILDTLPKLEQLDSNNELTKTNPWYYLHDCAISPLVRNTDGGKSCIELLKKNAKCKGFEVFSLTSVNNSAKYWENRGFCPVSPQNLSPLMREKLLSYGEDAVFMKMDL